MGKVLETDIPFLYWRNPIPKDPNSDIWGLVYTSERVSLLSVNADYWTKEFLMYFNVVAVRI